MLKNNFDNSLKLTRLYLLVSGIRITHEKWGVVRNFFIDIFLFNFNLFWVYGDVLGELFWLVEGIQVGKSFFELSLTAPCTTISLLSTAKSLPLYYKRQTIVQIIDTLRKIQPSEEKYENFEGLNAETLEKIKKFDAKVVKDSQKILKFVTLLLFSSSTVVVVIFCFLPITVMGYNYFKDGETGVLFPFLVKYYFDPYIGTRWPFVYFHQVLSTFIVCANVCGADTLLYAFCVYIRMHFKIVGHRFENMISWYSNREHCKVMFIRSVKHHQNLIELVKQVECVYSKGTLFNIITSSILICLSGFNMTSHHDTGAVIAFTTFFFMTLSQTFLLCIFGDMLISSSTQISKSVYNSRWYDADQEIKKNVLLVVMRTSKPCKLTAAKFADLNLTAFTTILSRSWSLFALLKTVYK